MEKNSQKAIEELLSLAGIKINGHGPADIQVHDKRLFDRVLCNGTIGLGEAYMDGWWDCKSLDQFFYEILTHRLDRAMAANWRLVMSVVSSKFFNQQSCSAAFVVARRHYDIGNDLFSLMLGSTMAYSCGYWDKANNLDEAQEAKFDLICRKLDLKPGMSILDIGCGWGTFMKYATKKYGVKASGITVSKEQVSLAKELCADWPIEIRLEDYRNLNEKFDRIVSVGMIEHVGHKNYKTYMNVINRCLKDDGLFLLHTIGGNESVTSTDPWIEKYIFPNSHLPSIKQLGSAIEDLFVMENWHNFGADYDKTLMAWYENFDDAWAQLKDKYGERFYRMWKYYLLSCAGAFRARKIQLWQIVLAKRGVPGGYKPIY